MKYLLLLAFLIGCSPTPFHPRHIMCMSPIGPVNITEDPTLFSIRDAGSTWIIFDKFNNKKVTVSKSYCIILQDTE